MFERFTREARTAVVGAQQVARDVGSRHVDTTHLLVALLEQDGPAARAVDALGVDRAALASRARADLRSGGLDADALAGLGIDLDAVRRQADAVFGRGALERAGRSPSGHIPFTPDAKKSLELALREAVRLKQSSIRGSHLLLGILRADCPARALLERSGVDTPALRDRLEGESRAA